MDTRPVLVEYPVTAKIWYIMQDFGLNNNIRIGSKTLHVQTSYACNTGLVATSVFEGGKLLQMREATLPQELSREQCEKTVQLFHNEFISDLEFAWLITKKLERVDNPVAQKKLGQYFLNKGMYEEARARFLSIRKQSDEKDPCNYELGTICYHTRDYEQALEYLKNAIIDFPRYADIHLLLAKTYLEFKEYKFSVNHLRNAINLNSKYHEAYFTFALVLLQSVIDAPGYSRLNKPQERMHEALDYLNQATSLSPDYDRQVVEEVLMIFDQPEKLAEAVQRLRQELERVIAARKKTIDENEFYLKFMFTGLDKDPEAMDMMIQKIEKELITHPEWADLHNSLGKVYLAKTWYTLAKTTEAFQEALNRNPRFESARATAEQLIATGQELTALLKKILE